MNEAIKIPASWSQNDKNLANTYLNIAKSLPMVTQRMKLHVENTKNGEGIITIGDLEGAFKFLEETINDILRSSISDKIEITWVKTTPTSTSANAPQPTNQPSNGKIHDSKQYNKKSVRITESQLRRAIARAVNRNRTTYGVVSEVIDTLSGKQQLFELDWKTSMNAANKAAHNGDEDRANKFARYSNNTRDKQFFPKGRIDYDNDEYQKRSRKEWEEINKYRRGDYEYTKGKGWGLNYQTYENDEEVPYLDGFAPCPRACAIRMLADANEVATLNVGSNFSTFKDAWEYLLAKGYIDGEKRSNWLTRSLVKKTGTKFVWSNGSNMDTTLGKWTYNNQLNMLCIDWGDNNIAFYKPL